MTQSGFFDSFDNKALSFKKLARFQNKIRSRKPYLIFFTARSGSSYLSDLLTKTTLAGDPAEYFNPAHLARAVTIVTARRGIQVDSIVDYLLWRIERDSTANGGFGFKATYAHYHPLIVTGLDRLLFSDFTLFYLYRQNIVNQAVSTYVMTETKLAHTNKEIAADVLAKARNLPYDGAKIRLWIERIWTQEKALQQYFKTLRSEVRTFEYQQLSADPNSVVKTILESIGASSGAPIGESSYKTVRGERNEALATEFLADNSNLKFLEDHGIPQSRLAGD